MLPDAVYLLADAIVNTAGCSFVWLTTGVGAQLVQYKESHSSSSEVDGQGQTVWVIEVASRV